MFCSLAPVFRGEGWGEGLWCSHLLPLVVRDVATRISVNEWRLWPLVADSGGLVTVGLRHTAEVVSPHSWLKIQRSINHNNSAPIGTALLARDNGPKLRCPSYEVHLYL